MTGEQLGSCSRDQYTGCNATSHITNLVSLYLSSPALHPPQRSRGRVQLQEGNSNVGGRISQWQKRKGKRKHTLHSKRKGKRKLVKFRSSIIRRKKLVSFESFQIFEANSGSTARLARAGTSRGGGTPSRERVAGGADSDERHQHQFEPGKIVRLVALSKRRQIQSSKSAQRRLARAHVGQGPKA